ITASAAPLGELHMNHQGNALAQTLSESQETRKRPAQSLHKKTLSSISLTSLHTKSKEKSRDEIGASGTKTPKVKKSKSQTSLSALLSRSRSSKSLKKDTEKAKAREAAEDSRNSHDKENQG